jgi:hypothetical protein
VERVACVRAGGVRVGHPARCLDDLVRQSLVVFARDVLASVASSPEMASIGFGNWSPRTAATKG